jgi:tRNA G18 (ribose-2'-O)-methylase SpoU
VGNGYFIIEGRLALKALLASPYKLLSVLVLDRRRRAVLDGLALPPDVPIYVVDDEVMATTTGFRVHRGLLALAQRPAPQGALDLLGRLAPRLVVVVEDVNDQENLGAIFRNAAAFGAGAVLLSPGCSDPLYRRTVRVSLGHVLRAPFARLEPWPGGLATLAGQGYQLVALTPRPAAARLEDVAAGLQEAKVAVVVGAEGPGLSEGALSRCQPVRIAMAEGVDSLNVAAATAVALHRLAELG